MDGTSLQSHLTSPVDTNDWFMNNVTVRIGSERLSSHSSRISKVLPFMIL